MALEKQIAGVNFTRGLDTANDRRLLLPGRMVELQNATLSEVGTVQRRDGFAAMASGTALSALAVTGDQLLALDGTTLSSWSSATGAFSSVGAVDPITISASNIVRGLGSNDSYDAATLGGLTCYVWRYFASGSVTSNVTTTIVDETTGARVLTETSLRSGSQMRSPRVAAVNGAFIIFYVDQGSGILYARVIQTSAPSTVGAETTLRTDVSTSADVIDACAAGTNAFVLYASTDATYSGRAITVTRSGTTPSVASGPADVWTQAQVAHGDIRGLACATFSSSLIGLYLIADSSSGSPGLWSAVVDSSMAISQAATQQDATAVSLGRSNLTAVLDGSTMFVYSDDWARQGEATATARLIRRTGFDSGNTITSASITWALSMTRPNGINGPFIAGKAFVVSGSRYVPVHMIETGTGTTQNSWFLLLDIGTTFRLSGHALLGSWGPPVDVTANIPSIVFPSASKPGICAGQRVLLSFADGRLASATGMVRLDVTFGVSAVMKAMLGPLLYFGTANGAMYDGHEAVERNFALAPDMVSAASAGAGNVPSGTRSIVALYEWVDGAGQRHQSAPSVAIQYTDAGATNVTVTVPTLTLTRRRVVHVVVFATEAGGTVFYRVNSPTAAVSNSLTAPTVNVTYNVTDINLIAGEILYTAGGALPNTNPPPCSIQAAHQDRLFTDVGDEAYSFQYSQPRVSGFGLQWNETLRGRVDGNGGALTAFASMDDKLVIFRKRRIAVLFGRGPNTAGLNNGYDLQDLPVDVGCSEPRSVLVMPEGVVFKATSKGWHVLGRDLQLRYIGDGVAEFDSQGVTSAVLLDTLQECRFTTNDAAGLALVYNYDRRDEQGLGQWSTFSNWLAVDAVWWPTVSAHIRASATSIFRELPAQAATGHAYGDGATSTTGTTPTTSPAPFTGSPIPVVWRTGWLKPREALQAYQRIWWLHLTGAVKGRPAAQTTIAEASLAPTTTLVVASTASFAGDLLEVITIGLGTARYETNNDGFAITDATHLELATATTQDHNVGDTVRGTPTLGASGTMQIDLYYDGDDSTIVQTITISDVSALVTGNAWHVRVKPALQKCEAIMLRVTQTPASLDPGASLDFSGLTLEMGVKPRKGRPLPAGKTF